MSEISTGTVTYRVTLNAQSMLVASQKALADFKKFSSDISTAGKKMEADIEASGKRTKAHFEAQASAASAAAQSISRDMMLAGGAMVGALALGVKAGAELEKKLNDVRNNTTMTAADFQLMQTAIKELGSKSSAPLDQLADGFMHITNFGFKAAESQKILEEAMKSALSTGGNVSTTANILAAVMHEFSIETNKAGAAMNVLHIASALGNQTLEQFNQAAGPMLAYAAGIGIKLEDAAAAMSALTRHGFDAAEAATQVRNQIAHIINPSEKAKEALERLSKQSGINLVKDFSVAGLQARGLYGVIGDLRAVSEKTGIAMGEITKDLIPAMRGGIGTLVLAGRGFDDFTEIIKQTAGAMGGTLDRTTKDYERTTKTTAFTVGMLKNNMELLGLDIQRSLGPIVNDLVARVGKLLRAFRDQSDEAKNWQINAAAYVAGFTLITGSVASLVIKLAELKTALSTLAVGKWVIPITFTIAYGKMLSDLITDPALGNQMSAGLGGAGAGSGFAALNERMKSEAARNLADKLARQGMAEGRIATTELLRARIPKSIFERFPPSGGSGDQKEDEDADKRKKRIQEIRADVIEAEFGANARAQYEAALKKFEDAKLVGRAMAEQEYNAKMEEIIDKMIQQRGEAMHEEWKKTAKLTEEARKKSIPQWDQLLGRENTEALVGGEAVDNMRAMANFARNFSDALGAIKTDRLKPIMEEARAFFREFNDMFRTPMVGKQEHDFRDPYQAMDQNAEGERNLALQERIRREMEKQRDAARQTMEAWAPVREALQRGFETAFGDMFKHGLKGFKSFFNSILQSFEQTLAKMAAEWAAQQIIFGAIKLAAFAGFDDPVNDATAGRWGRDFGKHFSMGALESASRMAVAGNGAAPAASGHTYYNFSFPGEIHIREEADISKLADGLAVEIQRRSRVRF